MSERGSGDPEIVAADQFTSAREISPDAGVSSSDLEIGRQNRHDSENVLNEALSARTLRGGAGAMNAVEQLGGGDRREMDRLVAEGVIDRGRRRLPALDGDQDAGVDQEAQGSRSSRG